LKLKVILLLKNELDPCLTFTYIIYYSCWRSDSDVCWMFPEPVTETSSVMIDPSEFIASSGTNHTYTLTHGICITAKTVYTKPPWDQLLWSE